MYKLVKVDDRWLVKDQEDRLVCDASSTVFFTGRSEPVGLTLPQMVWVTEVLNYEMKRQLNVEQARISTEMQLAMERIICGRK